MAVLVTAIHAAMPQNTAESWGLNVFKIQGLAELRPKSQTTQRPSAWMALTSTAMTHTNSQR
jgi:hypothetical protein